MKDKKAIALLVQELENDYSYIKEGTELLHKAEVRVEASGWNDELDLMVLGGFLHALYNSVEAYFFRVAKFFENNIDQQAWHRDLLDRMVLDIPDIRPAVVTDKTLAERIDELRRFRHLFRNLYKTRLRADKLRIVNDAARNLDNDFHAQHKAFVDWLRALSEAL